ncbi:helix-turn-helix transcriptional regulator [Listeria monocytogenes]|nr:helix-turn-helix transcriptional regulator [Listeria monocytogenes]
MIQKNIELVRQSRGISKKAVAEYIGISQMSYWRFEKGKTKKIDPEMIKIIGDFFNVDFKIFFDNELTETVIKEKGNEKVT